MEQKINRIKELTKILNEAAKAYYSESKELMTNFEYDKLYDELEALEKETGVVLAKSPTQRVGYEVLSSLPKEAHASPMLSLDKTKDWEVLAAFAGEHKCLLSWKLDGLTIVLTYENGMLAKAVTRGNGSVGEVITNNARVFKNVPLQIPYKGTLVLRGEAVISYEDFEKINAEIEEEDSKYKNPRNLCSGSVRQLNNEITAKRNVHFQAFSLVNAEDVDFENSREQQMLWLKNMGFSVVEYKVVTEENMLEAVQWFANHVQTNAFPSDGLVLVFDDIAYGKSLGRTAKFPRDSIAFKWADEIRETTLLEIEWSPSRTGLINPVAIFVPVDLEGTTVSRASVHNVSIVKELELGIGDTIEVYKANMIIPQIARNLTRSSNLTIPDTCPVCGGSAQVMKTNDVESLYCMNPECQVKHIKAFSLFVSRDALNMEGLSEATLEKFIGEGFLKEFADIFHLSQYRDKIVEMEGFGEKSYENLIESIDKARKTTLPRLIYALGISGVGIANAKLICKEFDYDLERMCSATKEELSEISGIGPVIGEAFATFFEQEKNQKILERLLPELEIQVQTPNQGEHKLAGKIFVVTGSLEHFTNRNALKELIEQQGGKVTGSVTGKTDYLINNDTTSNSSKNKKAKELQIPILSEEDFLKMLEE